MRLPLAELNGLIIQLRCDGRLSLWALFYAACCLWAICSVLLQYHVLLWLQDPGIPLLISRLPPMQSSFRL
jgi:hypothetical protein